MGTVLSVYSSLLVSGDDFRQRLTPELIDELRLGRNIFHATSLVPALLYYSGLGVDRESPKFPATISYTIRAGLPFWVHHVMWGHGWAKMLRVIYQVGDWRMKLFAAQMIVTGIITTGLCGLGQSPTHDAVHMICAGMLLHLMIDFTPVDGAFAVFSILFLPSFVPLDRFIYARSFDSVQTVQRAVSI